MFYWFADSGRASLKNTVNVHISKSEIARINLEK